MVSGADAVIEPRTVVVEPLHASVTDGAMARSFGTDHLTVRAQEGWIETL